MGTVEICMLLKDYVIDENNWNGINKKEAPTFKFIVELILATKPMKAFCDATRIIIECTEKVER